MINFLKKNYRIILFLIIFIIIIIAIFFHIKENTIEPKKNTSLIINNEDVTQKLEGKIIVKDNIQYLSLNDINNLLDAKIYKEQDKIIIITSKKISLLKLNKNTVEINGSLKEIKGQAFEEEKIIYIPISELNNVYDIEISYSEMYKNLVIDCLNKKQEKAQLTKNTILKREKSILSDSLEKLQRETKIIFISEENGWAKIRTENGNIGYIKKKNLANFEIEREDMYEENQETKQAGYEKNITNKSISTYEDRKKVIDEILFEAIEKKQQNIKIIYNKDTKAEEYQRFKSESTVILKECGITLVF